MLIIHQNGGKYLITVLQNRQFDETVGCAFRKQMIFYKIEQYNWFIFQQIFIETLLPAAEIICDFSTLQDLSLDDR